MQPMNTIIAINQALQAKHLFTRQKEVAYKMPRSEREIKINQPKNLSSEIPY
jgi:hypothetical protein